MKPTMYMNKAGIVRTREDWLRLGTEFYQDLKLPVPDNLWDKMSKVIKLREVVDLGDFLDVPEANKNLFKMTARNL